MFEESFLRDLGAILLAGVLFALIGRQFKIPSLVMYMFGGLVIGPFTGLVEMEHTLELIREVGIILLLFLVGLELSLDKIRDVGKVALFAGIGQVLFTAAGGLVVCLLLDFTLMESIFLAVALTFSSTVVVVKLLDQKGELDHLYGRIAVGIFLVQDLVVIVVMTFLAGLGSAGGEESESLALGETLLSLGFAFFGMGVLLVFVLVASRYLLPRPFGWAARSPETLFIWSLAWCFLIVVMAELMGLSSEIGAFLAGLSLAQLKYNADLQRRVHPLMNFFIAVFFVTLGIQMEFDAALGNMTAVIVLSLFVLIGNPFIFIFIISRFGYGEKTTFKTSVTVAQISEFSFIFAAMGMAAGLIGNEIMSIVSVIGLITIAVSAYMILYSDQLYEWCRRARLLSIFKAPEQDDEKKSAHRSGHIIVIGMNGLGRKLVGDLHQRGESVLAIDTDPGKLQGLPGDQLIGSVEYSSVREAADLSRARLVVSALQIEDTNLMLGFYCREAGVPCAINAFDTSLMPDLIAMDAAYLMMPTVDGIYLEEKKLTDLGILKS